MEILMDNLRERIIERIECKIDITGALTDIPYHLISTETLLMIANSLYPEINGVPEYQEFINK